MTKEDILTHLKKETSNNRLRFPDSLLIDSENGILTLTMEEKGLNGNMQTDPAAFEGWAIAIKAIIPQYAEKVIIQWKGEGIIERKHYNRFLYRLIRFTQSYQWASYKPLDDQSKKDLKEINDEINEWVVNYPGDKSQEQAAKEEAQLESNLVEVLPGIKNHQLPVGLFHKDKSKETTRTPRGGSQIDLWSIEDKTFTVYELKTIDNRKVGIISELMFYSNVIKDLVDGDIHFAQEADQVTIRDFDKVFKNISNNLINRVCGVFLTNNLHPLLQKAKNLFVILNGNNRGIVYKQIGYKMKLLYTISQ